MGCCNPKVLGLSSKSPTQSGSPLKSNEIIFDLSEKLEIAAHLVIISTSSEPLIDLVDSESNGKQIPTGSEGEGSLFPVESEFLAERSIINSSGQSGLFGENGRNPESFQCDNSIVITNREADSIPGESNKEIADPNNLEDVNGVGNSRSAFMEPKVQFVTPTGGVRGESERSNRNSNDRESSKNGSNRRFRRFS
ncbi:acetyl-CoA acetyltransferase [Corchorus olitorius]|uniref:Acetyl-CoA acetyltransferase n=1 Tax=Corchorus olitorius TaxID=93759 RepID=A0A1R3IR31_9ROSI|nr:acetyl-CoA acetyltransferase [Corchorus olitorius]